MEGLVKNTLPATHPALAIQLMSAVSVESATGSASSEAGAVLRWFDAGRIQNDCANGITLMLTSKLSPNTEYFPRRKDILDMTGGMYNQGVRER